MMGTEFAAFVHWCRSLPGWTRCPGVGFKRDGSRGPRMGAKHYRCCSLGMFGWVVRDGREVSVADLLLEFRRHRAAAKLMEVIRDV